MYISKIRMQNFRCFSDTSVKFYEGLNVFYWSSVKELFPSPVTLFESNSFILYSNHLSLTLI